MYKAWRTVIVLVASVAAVPTVTSLYADSMHDESGAIMAGCGMMSLMGKMHGMMEGCRACRVATPRNQRSMAQENA
jgi:hypothetical protein